MSVGNLIGQNWLTTRVEKLEDWAQRHSFWPFPFGTACCAIEFMSTVSSHYDMSRFGSEVVRFSPRQSDILIVAGTINDKMAPVLKKIYDQMADPKWVISMGACACSGGFYRAYHVMQGIDEIIPVDVYVPGCPPSPEGLIYGILQLKERIARDRARGAGAGDGYSTSTERPHSTSEMQMVQEERESASSGGTLPA
ncbi:MAG TPA: NADH-quinone oxidoreductase subunit NuoB [Thermoanaerobaculia bacterium]|nr:NADH-quinone oxidoreductase subunit NuoB [Thermoanaerobaculia bacterium]